MTAPIGNSANLASGIKAFGQVTNTYGGYLQSGGVAYSLALPFLPDQFQWWRYTTYGTAGTIGQGVWFRDMPAGDELAIRAIVDNGSTGLLDLVLETTNGITLVTAGGTFPNEHKTITGITAATPGVVTSAAHGYTSGQRVVITKVQGTIGASVNNNTFVVQVLSSSTYALYDIYGLPYTTAGSYSSGGQGTLTGPSLGIQQSPVSYSLTLGSQVMGADNDVIYFVASKFNSYYNLGDIV